jgi:hypothetical protein
MLFGISWGWIALAAVVYFIIGAAWYSPVLFSNHWLKELGKKRSELNMAASPMVMTFASLILLVIVEAYLVQAAGVFGFWSGLVFGALLWLGLVATTALINNLFQNASKKLYLIDQGYHLVGIAVAAAILAHGLAH